jgi:hypothetical protein
MGLSNRINLKASQLLVPYSCMKLNDFYEFHFVVKIVNCISFVCSMYIYNVTVNVDESIHNDWLSWMKNEHIPNVMATGRFIEHRFLKLLSVQEDETGSTYAIQYLAETLGQIESYLQTEAPSLQKKHIDRYQTRVMAFRTVLEEV